MHWQTDGFGLVGKGAFDGLLDPPGTIGGELAALRRIKPFHCLHQTNIALANQVQQGEANTLVITSDFDDQAQIGLDHVFACLLVPLFDTRGQLHFFLRR